MIIILMMMMTMMTMTDDPTRDQRAMHGANMVKQRPKYLLFKKKTLSGYLTLVRGKLVVYWNFKKKMFYGECSLTPIFSGLYFVICL